MAGGVSLFLLFLIKSDLFAYLVKVTAFTVRLARRAYRSAVSHKLMTEMAAFIGRNNFS